MNTGDTDATVVVLGGGIIIIIILLIIASTRLGVVTGINRTERQFIDGTAIVSSNITFNTFKGTTNIVPYVQYLKDERTD